MKKFYIIVIAVFWVSSSNAQNAFYDENNINVIEIFFSQSNWDQLMDNNYAMGNGDRLIADSVIINGISFDSVGVKYKGNSSYNQNNVKNPLNIKLNYIKKNQDYQGFYTLKLSNGDKDPTFVREVLSYFIARHYMQAPKANYTQVYINGNYIGLYGNIESINKKFVEERFYSDDDNTLFKCNPQNLGGGGGNPNCSSGIGSSLEYLGPDSICYEDYYELQSDYGLEDMKNFTYQLDQNPNNIEQHFDVDRGIWFLVLNNLFVNMDSYIGPFCQNYYLFKDDNDRYNPIVWDFNESFGHFSMINTPGPGNPPATTQDLQEMDPFLRDGDATRPLCKIIFADQTYRKMYVAHMKTIIDEFFSNNYYHQKADSLHSTISAAFQSDQNTFYTWNQATQNITTSVTGGGGPGGGTKVGITELMNARTTYLLAQNRFLYPAPNISNINLSAVNPSPYTTIDISAYITSATGALPTAFLGYRNSPAEIFTKVPMIDQGSGVFSATINLGASDVQYYIYAENSGAGIFSPVRAEHEFYTISVTADLVINELMPLNTSTVADQDGEYDDWIELYNNSNSDIPLLGFYLSDNNNNLKWAFPDTFIVANGYLIIWADENGSELGLHANFKLNGSGEQLTLYDSTYAMVVDEVVFGAIPSDMGYARVPNGTGPFIIQDATFSQNNESSVSISVSFENVEFSVYPNPASNIIFLKGNVSTIEKIAVFTIFGQNVLSQYNTNKIYISTFKSGMYFIKINNDQTLKFIKQ